MNKTGSPKHSNPSATYCRLRSLGLELTTVRLVSRTLASDFIMQSVAPGRPPYTAPVRRRTWISQYIRPLNQSLRLSRGQMRALRKFIMFKTMSQNMRPKAPTLRLRICHMAGGRERMIAKRERVGMTMADVEIGYSTAESILSSK